ncbi:MAG: cellulase family glycosylhydrolase, partial [Huintestinicola sp.]
MKKILAMIMSAAMTAAVFTGCGKAAEKPADSGAADATNSAVSEVTFPDIAIADNAVDYAKSMKLGWNLGNTLDAVTSSSLDSETLWGQPKTTKELIQFVKDSGFTTIRIPVSWGQHTTDENYTIDPAWMARVNEVVDYAVESGLYIILNSHHDCNCYYPTEEKSAEGEKYLRSVWTQIAENFKDYDERLIFESMNEPRLTGTNKEWWFKDNDEEGVASIKTIIKYNQIFVDMVRAGDGYNK